MEKIRLKFEMPDSGHVVEWYVIATKNPHLYTTVYEVYDELDNYLGAIFKNNTGEWESHNSIFHQNNIYEIGKSIDRLID